MSRIGKKPIIIPEKTEISISGGLVNVKGSLGTLSRNFGSDLLIKMEDKKITVNPKRNDLQSKASWGTIVAHIENMIKGVNVPFQKKLVVEGIGYKSDVKGEDLNLSLGFSHPVKIKIPKDLKVTAEKNIITVSGMSIESVGQFAARIRSLKKPEPYKGKGIHYETETVRRKQGKKTA